MNVALSLVDWFLHRGRLSCDWRRLLRWRSIDLLDPVHEEEEEEEEGEEGVKEEDEHWEETETEEEAEDELSFPSVCLFVCWLVGSSEQIFAAATLTRTTLFPGPLLGSGWLLLAALGCCWLLLATTHCSWQQQLFSTTVCSVRTKPRPGTATLRLQQLQGQREVPRRRQPTPARVRQQRKRPPRPQGLRGRRQGRRQLRRPSQARHLDQLRARQ